ncbi:MAG: GNAT family N-acetyltransferase [Candidatus Bathyarchaeota archaeon]|jgi:ribosomal protein S18 acetylase RimI-like enzyme|nr:GNAT family N-acetyltransferase [Candidatus Bathyarchaeota archaeon A05DMB-5]MDH7557271.1 GNAT family N-acetyltransferase [Candidatus Bathyarchaeota archaeon]
MEIRKLTIDNYEEIVRLWRKAGLPFKPKGRDSKEAIAAQMRANPEFFLGVFENNRLVGVAILSSDMRKGWINRLAVDPDYRNRGFAKALISESEQIFRKHGLGIFCALIEDYNTASKKLFKECGYVEHRDILYFSKRDSEEV